MKLGSRTTEAAEKAVGVAAWNLQDRFKALGLGTSQLFIDGKWRSGLDGLTWPHVNPATNEHIADLAVAGPRDVALAVEAARKAFDTGPWPRLRARERRMALQKLARAVHENADLLNRCQTLDNAMPYSRSSRYRFSAAYAADLIEYYAGCISDATGQTFPAFTAEDDMHFFSLPEPVGVVASISAWNAPILQIANKVAPALAAGCTVVLKPSEYASLTAIAFAQIIASVEFPSGVFNLVIGPGDPTGEALITNPLVDKIAFTGSRSVGERVLMAAARGIKRVTLELGGKSPGIVFDDVPDVAAAAREIAARVLHGMSGQTCSAQTRALVHRSRYEAFLEAALHEAGRVQLGDPFAEATTAAPIINARQLERVERFIGVGLEEGARPLLVGRRPGGSLADGNWITPTIFADVDNDSQVSQQEIFGPVLTVTRFSSEEEAVATANATEYGLSAGIYTADIGRAFRMCRAVRAGTVGVNGYTAMPNTPFGGVKTSGLGREGGRAGLDAYLETKTVMVRL